jgi:hypothetical protein
MANAARRCLPRWRVARQAATTMKGYEKLRRLLSESSENNSARRAEP